MKVTHLAMALGTLVVSHAAVFEFDFGPGGMNGANLRPTPLVTSATGGELTLNFDEPGISYDQSTGYLFLNFGWGSKRGYSDLIGSFLSARIYGPANEEQEGEDLYSLTQLVTTMDAHSGGVFQKALPLVDHPSGRNYTIAQQEAQLMSGLWYITVTSNFAPAGEIRGQLMPVPEPQHYAVVTALGLAAFCFYRRFKHSRPFQKTRQASVS